MVVLIFIYLMANDVEHFFHVLVHLYIFFFEASVLSFGCKSSLYTLRDWKGREGIN